MPWQALDAEGRPQERPQAPFEGVPQHLRRPLIDWIEGRLGHRDDQALLFQLDYRLDPELGDYAASDLIGRAYRDEELALTLIDWILFRVFSLVRDGTAHDVVNELVTFLDRGGSAWAITPREDDGELRLSRRAAGPVLEVIESLSASGRAHQHLVAAWNRSMGREPDPSGAYREAVRAVEAAAKPVVVPRAENATLGTIISALQDQPHKWEATVGTVEDACSLMRSLWTSQLDRHGTDDESVPLNVSQQQAEAATHISLLLVRMFVSGDIATATPT